MKALIQRVSEATVSVEGALVGKIGQGLLILLGVHQEDELSDLDWLVHKIVNLRVFADGEGKMNLSLLQIKGEILLVSQFTLLASTKKGHRPSYTAAAPPDKATQLYELMGTKLSEVIGKEVQKGVFGADMQVTLTNDGPVTIMIDSKDKS